MSIQHLCRFHRLAEQIIAYAQARNLTLAREAYAAGFDGSFSIVFEAVLSAGAFDRARTFQLIRDGRDNLLSLEELAPANDRRKLFSASRRREREWHHVHSRQFDGGTAWDGAMFDAAMQLIDEIAR